MAGRPKNPDWIVEPFAPDVNYAAGALPWQGTATKVAWAGAPSVGFTPKMGVPSQAMNYLFNAYSTYDQKAKDYCTSLVNFVGQIQATNFLPAPTISGMVANSMFWNAASRKWHICGNSALVYTSDDRGATWSTETGIASVAGSPGETCRTGDADASGNLVIATGTRYIFNLTGSTWTKVDVVGTNVSPLQSFSLYDPVNSLWCFIFESFGPQPYTSANRTSWTSRISTLSGTTLTISAAINKTAGIIATAIVVGTTISVETSSNGGVTWTARGTYTTTISSANSSSLSYNSTTDTWLFVVGKNTATRSCEVWKSTDNCVTFTKVCTLAANYVYGPCGSGNMWVALSDSSTSKDVVVSLDAGATWQRAGLSLSGLSVGAYYGGNQTMLLSQDKMRPGLILDLLSLGSLT